MEETRSKLNSTQKIVVNLLQQLVTECTDRVPATQPCTVVSTTVYRVHRQGTGYTAFVQLTRSQAGYRVIRPSPFNSVLILGQVDSKYLQIWLQLTGYRVFKSPDQFTGYTTLFSPKPVYRVITSTTGYRAYQQGTSYTALLHQNRLQSLPT